MIWQIAFVLTLAAIQIGSLVWIYFWQIKPMQNRMQEYRRRLEATEICLDQWEEIRKELPAETVYGEFPIESIDPEISRDIENMFPGNYDNDWDEIERVKERALERLVT